LKSKIKPLAMRAGVKKVGLKELRGLKLSHISWVRLSALIISHTYIFHFNQHRYYIYNWITWLFN